MTDVSKDLRSLDLTLREGASTRDDPKEGDLVMGVVKKVEGSFAAISLGPRNVGRVNIADVDDAYCDRPLSRLSPGMFVACRVLRADEELRKIDLSLR